MPNIAFFKDNILSLKQKLFRTAFYIAGSESEAEDIVQDIMMRMWDKKEIWPTIDNIEKYCTILARNAAIDRHRSRPFGKETENIPLDIYDESPSPTEKIEWNETRQIVWYMIEKLPFIQQEVVKLREFEELSYKEISTRTHLSEDQVKITLFRARKKIKEMYKKLQENEQKRYKNAHR